MAIKIEPPKISFKEWVYIEYGISWRSLKNISNDLWMSLFNEYLKVRG